MQTTFMTIQALQFAAKQSADSILRRSPLRVAALAQPVSGRGKWLVCRLTWDTEPARAVEFITKGLPPPRLN